ncbi:LmeA family phospholipid-binding protein [Nocardia sp. 004]|uniref:LmeA family phospholipid-binding protein n=1 Tax=Nocardia sp. 004 TaxID=3385978 RepID=UPI0039A2B6CE
MRKLIIGLLCLAGFAVLVDFSIAAYSEYRVSRALRDGADLTADPEVTMHGFPFLGQAWNSRYDNVEIRARANRQDIPGEIALEATLTGVRLPVGELVEGSLRSVPVERVNSRLRVEPTELGRLFDIPDLQVHSRPEEKTAKANKADEIGDSDDSGMTTTDALVLTGTLPKFPGTQYSGQKISVQADLLLEADQVKIVATDFYRADSGAETMPVAAIPETERPAVLALFTRTIDTKELPFGIQPTTVSAKGGQIVVEGKGTDVTIDLDRLHRP